MVKVAVLGYGTVGSGVVEVLKTNAELIKERVGEAVEVAYVLDKKEFPGDPIEKIVTHDLDEIMNDEEVKIVVEVMGGVEPAFTFVKRALEAGKHVTTSNKALVAKHGAELLKIAKENKVNFLFEASVGGGIPILRALHESLTGDRIDKIVGILNGTTNYMMTKMFYEGADYDAVLKEAQDNGFAERNPEADVEGYDACRKIAILASIISGKRAEFEEIHCEGITKITVDDMKYAKELGMSIKLLATCKREGEDKFSAIVCPCLLNKTHPLFNVDGVFNSVFVQGNMLGDSMFYGSGAGKLPTASAVVGDIVELAKNLDKDLGFWWNADKLELTDKGEVAHRFFVRVKDTDKSKVAADFANAKIVEVEGLADEFGFVTEKMEEKVYDEKIKAYEGKVVGMIRVEE